MTLKELQKWIKTNLFNKDGRTLIPKQVSYKAKWIKENPEIFQQIINLTNFLDDGCPLNQRIYHIVYEIFYNPKCIECNNLVKYKSFNKGYSNYCSQKCVNKVRKRKFREKYNTDSPLQIKEFKQKAKNTNLERHGCKNYNNPDKRKQTNLSKYGVDNPLLSEEIKNKKAETNLSKYGTVSPLQNKDVQKKTVETLESKYGKGIDNVFKSNEVQEKIRENREKKTGFRYNSQSHITNIEYLTKEYIEQNFINNNYEFDLEKFQRFYNLSYSHSYKKLTELDVYYKKSVSREEENLKEFVYSLTDNVIFNSRKVIDSKELDIYLPNYNLAIEYNGIYWHCDDHERITPTYHLEKTEECLNNNIQLLHIFSNQWNDLFKRDIWKSIILGKLNKNHRIYARKCDIKNVENSEKDAFLENNHIQGSCQSSINIGLYYEGDLVAIMTFGKPRFNRKANWELLRFCNKKFSTVVGGASKLLNAFIHTYGKNIVTYADRTYSNGNLYSKLGFEFVGENKPSYFYFKNDSILSRYLTQKKNLYNIL